jgi:hypothetical protein
MNMLGFNILILLFSPLNRAASSWPIAIEPVPASRTEHIDGYSGNTGHFGPGPEGLASSGSILVGGGGVAEELKEVVDLAVGGEKTLCLPCRFEALARAVRFSGRLSHFVSKRPIWLAEAAEPVVASTAGRSTAASQQRAHSLSATWLTLERLPKYAPELNDIERRWRDLKQHQLANRTVTNAGALDRPIHDAVARLNHERQPNSSPSITRTA